MTCTARRWAVTVLLAASLGPLGCRGTRGPLPSGAALGGYEDGGDVESYTPLTLYTYMNGGAEVFQEYGLSQAWVARYMQGTTELTVELYKMGDDGAAGALWTYMRRPGTETEIAPGCPGSLTGSEARLAKGHHVLVCRNDDPMAEQAEIVRSLCTRLIEGIEGACGVGSLFDELDPDGRVPGTEVALVGPLGFNLRPWLARLGRDGFTRGWLGTYAVPEAEAEALVAEYATSEAARSAVAPLAEGQSTTATAVVKGRRIVVVHAEGVSEKARGDLVERLSSR